jgi:hypothetical protein
MKIDEFDSAGITGRIALMKGLGFLAQMPKVRRARGDANIGGAVVKWF